MIVGLVVLVLIRFRLPLESTCFEEIQLNVHSFFHRVQLEQALNSLSCLSF